MQILDFKPCHVWQAYGLACRNYAEERAAVPILPNMRPVPPETFAENGLGVAAFDGGEMLGFLACYRPWENAFTGTARGTFSPVEAHGAVSREREKIYKLLYQAAAEKWVAAGISSHSIALYAHDTVALHAFFSCGFGLRCVDAIRDMGSIPSSTAQYKNAGANTCTAFSQSISPNLQHHIPQASATWHPGLGASTQQSIILSKAGQDELPLVARLGVRLVRHLAASPCFMRPLHEETIASWLARRTERGSRVFTAACGGTLTAFLEVTSEGENFATLSPSMINICGAYCLPEFRGQGVMPNLLNHAVCTLRREGYTQLGVDYESFNLAAQGFWPKYFTPYTNGVVRRIDENIFTGTRPSRVGGNSDAKK